MLCELRINNVALIDECSLSFKPGFTVFTGETGAGKSLIVGAISLLLGQAAQSSFIKEGEAHALIEGGFSVNKNDIPHVSNELCDYLDDGYIFISRFIHKDNRKSRARINGHTVTVKLLKKIASELITIIGQHEHMTLLDSKKQRDMLDSYAGDTFKTLMTEFTKTYLTYNMLRDEKKALESEKDDRDAKLEFYAFQIEDITSQDFRPEEDTELESKRKDIKHVHKLTQNLSRINQALDIIQEQSSLANKLTQELASTSDVFSNLEKRLSEFHIEVDDIKTDIEKESESAQNIDPSEIDTIEHRLDTIFKYKQKYHATSISDLLDKLDAIKRAHAALDKLESNSKELDKKIRDCEEQLTKQANALHSKRLHAAKSLEGEVMAHLNDLGFVQANLAIQVKKTTDIYQHGYSDVSFLLSTNPGFQPAPISEIASGGELSRVMLAIRTVFLDRLTIPSIIFDEIDNGVGGIIANKIGDKLAGIARKTQVFCITHLPQIAQFADQHLFISKDLDGKRIKTNVKSLNDTEIRHELTRMVGGESVTSRLHS